MNTPFKICSFCQKQWNTQDDFLNDPEIELIGYQADFEDLLEGLFCFNHNGTCGTTLGMPVYLFRSLYDGPVYEENKRGSEECPGYCLNKDNLDNCPANCACQYVRGILQVLKEYSRHVPND